MTRRGPRERGGRGARGARADAEPAVPMRVDRLPERDLAVLRVFTPEVGMDHKDLFKALTEELLASPQSKLVVDLSKTRRIFSLFIGSLVDLHQRAGKESKTLTILAPKSIYEILQKMNLGDVLDVKVL